MVEILFLVENGQKGRHDCVKSEHLLYEQNISKLNTYFLTMEPRLTIWTDYDWTELGDTF